jgi:hypothetical protein
MGGPSLGWIYILRENLYSTCATKQEQKWRSWWVAHVVVYNFFSEILDSTWWWPPINSRNMHVTLSTIFVNTVVLILRHTYTIFYQCQTHNRDDVTKDLQRYFQFLVFSSRKNMAIAWKTFDIIKKNGLIIQDDCIFYTAYLERKLWNQIAGVADNVSLYQASCPSLVTANSN